MLVGAEVRELEVDADILAAQQRNDLLQGIAICGRCGRRMSLRYTGPNGDYPVYCCRSDRDQQGSALCQEVRACGSTRLSSASSSMLWRRIRSRLRLPQLGSLRKRAGSSNDNGRCDASALATRPSGRVANMTLWSLRIASLRARSSAAGAYAFGRTGSRISIEAGRKKVVRGFKKERKDSGSATPTGSAHVVPAHCRPWPGPSLGVSNRSRRVSPA